MVAAIKSADFIWISVALAILLAAGIIAIIWVKRRFSPSDKMDPNATTSFTLEEIRRMHQEGQISPQEYQSLRDQIINQNLPNSSGPTDR